MLSVDELLKAAEAETGVEARSNSVLDWTPSELADRMEMVAVKLGSMSTGTALSDVRDADRNSAAMALSEFMGKLASAIERRRLKGIDRRLLALFAGGDAAQSLAKRVDITDKYEALTGTRLQ
jgi:hypothetical protein